MFRRFGLYPFLPVLAWSCVIWLWVCLSPDEKTGGGITLFVLIVLTQLVSLAAAVVLIVYRIVMAGIQKRFLYCLTGVFNFAVGLAGSCLLVTGNLTSSAFMILFGVNLLTGILFLADATRVSMEKGSSFKTIHHEYF